MDKLDKAFADFKATIERRQAPEAKLGQARALEIGARALRQSPRQQLRHDQAAPHSTALNAFPLFNALPIWPGCAPLEATGDIVVRAGVPRR